MTLDSLVTPSGVYTSSRTLSVADPVFQLGLIYIYIYSPDPSRGRRRRGDETYIGVQTASGYRDYLHLFAAGQFLRRYVCGTRMPAVEIDLISQGRPYDIAVANFETLFEQRYRRCGVGLLPSHLVVDQRVPAPYATLSADSWL